MFSAVEREITLNMMLHAADISNPCKNWDLSKKWSDMVTEEFFRQVCNLTPLLFDL